MLSIFPESRWTHNSNEPNIFKKKKRKKGNKQRNVDQASYQNVRGCKMHDFRSKWHSLWDGNSVSLIQSILPSGILQNTPCLGGYKGLLGCPDGWQTVLQNWVPCLHVTFGCGPANTAEVTDQLVDRCQQKKTKKTIYFVGWSYQILSRQTSTDSKNVT